MNVAQFRVRGHDFAQGMVSHTKTTLHKYKSVIYLIVHHVYDMKWVT